MSQKWSYLQPGDVVDVIAPSSYSPKKEIESGLTYLKSLGLQVRFPAGLVKPDFVYANTVSETLNFMKWAFYNSESKAVWCLRGGSGTFRLMDALWKWKKPRKTKMFIGISDTTLLHMFLNQKWKWPTLHGPMISMLGRSQAVSAEKKSLEAIILGQKEKIAFSGLSSLNEQAQKKRTVRAPVVGGNLCIVESSLGTAYEIDFRGKIAFLEDIDERGYAIERSLMHLENAGVIRGARAVVFGDFVGGNERDGKNLTQAALRRFAARQTIPVFRGIPSGHAVPVKTLPLNSMCELRGGARGTLTCETGGYGQHVRKKT